MKHFFFFLMVLCPCLCHGLSTHGLIVPEEAFFTLLPHDPYKKTREYFFWWRSLPTVGLEESRLWDPVFYPFIPHFFSLQTLAPRQGQGVGVGVIDNGIASLTLRYKKEKNVFRGHPYLTAVSGAPSCISEGKGKICWAEFQELVQFYTAQQYQELSKKIFSEYRHELVQASFLESFFKKYGDSYDMQKIKNCFAHAFVVELPDGNSTYAHLLSVPTFKNNNLRIPRYADVPWLLANHGTHCAGLIVGRSDRKTVGIAPRANVVSIKAAVPGASGCDVLALVRALSYARKQGLTVISLSYSMHNSGGYAQEFEENIKNIPYSCVSTGNEISPKSNNYLCSLSGLTAHVGSFGMHDDERTSEKAFHVSPFSQPTNHSAWHIVLPGEAMLSCCYQPSPHYDATLFVFMQGTSSATPLLAGFFALMAAEFYPDLTHDQIKCIARQSTVFLHNTPSWHTQTGSGTLDMRMALFIGHVLRVIVNTEKTATIDFLDYVICTRRYLLRMVNDYGKEKGINIHFEDGMIDFLQKARKHGDSLLYTHQHLKQIIDTTVHAVKSIIKNSKG